MKKIGNIIFIILVNMMIIFFFWTLSVNILKTSIINTLVVMLLGVLSYLTCKRLTKILNDERKQNEL